MHELSIATNIVNLIEEQRKEHGFERVSKIYLKIGEFSSVVPEALEFSFSIAAKGTVAEAAELVIEIIPLMLRCKTCGKEFHTEPYIFICPDCGNTDLEMLSGTELQIDSLEV